MKSLFSAKWLTFYGSTIAFVIALFSVVTNYGEANLKAQPKISGRYKISAAELPGCLKGKDLVLSIEQSGVYLNGSLLETSHSTQEQTASRKKPSLMGTFRQPNLELSGTLAQIEGCANSAIALQSTLNQSTLIGKLNFDNTAIDFVANSESIKK
ncbi:hypothetical protein [Leptolyngbya sp. NIES-2104]|uniref:hypothetical protein n=1 Tax=Leptolyngbya sp. NIES-2104 TaxID=1552121 RepID=UPI0006EC5D7B|nr:hypothetical protein [Leptolyngbya sp. NIES-2104]GAP95593.1 hypothetical protein NIES2104_21170 [Leptolyngbya sp. NIES-2104]